MQEGKENTEFSIEKYQQQEMTAEESIEIEKAYKHLRGKQPYLLIIYPISGDHFEWHSLPTKIKNKLRVNARAFVRLVEGVAHNQKRGWAPKEIFLDTRPIKNVPEELQAQADRVKEKRASISERLSTFNPEILK